MTPKEYLNQAREIDRRIQLTIAKADKLRSALEYKSPQLDGLGSGGSGAHDSIADAIIKLADYERRANELIGKLVSKRIEIEQTIQSVQDAAQREVLERRYLLYQQWEGYFDERTGEYVKGIAEEMRYSERQIYRLHGEALKNVSVNVSECQL